MAAYPDGLPTRVDGSLGRTKTNARAVEDLSYEVPAEEFNILADSVEGIAAILGLPNAVGMPAALATAISSGKVFALQQISTNGVQIAESTTLVEILAIDLYVATSAQTAPSWRLIFGAYGLHLVPSDYGGAGVVTINGVADIVTFAEAGVYLLVGDGANAWTLTPATDYSAIDGAIAAVQADATQALSDAAAANTLAQNAYNGLAGKLDVAGHTSLSIPASTAGTLADVAASSNDTLFGRVAGAFGFFNVTLSMIAAAVKSAAQNVESLRQIDTATPAAIGTAAAGSSVKAAASDHVHAHGSQTDGSHHAAATTSTAGFMSTTQVARQNGLIQSYDPLAAFPSYQTIQVISKIEHFASNGTAQLTPFTYTANSGAAAIGTPIAGRVGIFNFNTSTSAAAAPNIGTAGTTIVFGSGLCRFRSDIVLGTASDGTDTYAARFGFNDSGSATPGDGTDGAFFRYTHSVNGGQWQCVNRNNGSENAMDSGVAGISASYQCLEIEVNAAASSVAYYINGALVATNTSQIPSGASRATGVAASIVKSAGTTARGFDIDLIGFHCELTTGV